VYQRSQRTDKALDVWNRLEKLYPDDARVQEQIATTLVEEGQFEQALPRLVKLADATEDKYRQSALRMDAADLKVRLKKTPEALADFEKMLAS
jgi:tetratricopeptide (TPR) repeat protein